MLIQERRERILTVSTGLLQYLRQLLVLGLAPTTGENLTSEGGASQCPGVAFIQQLGPQRGQTVAGRNPATHQIQMISTNANNHRYFASSHRGFLRTILICLPVLFLISCFCRPAIGAVTVSPEIVMLSGNQTARVTASVSTALPLPIIVDLLELRAPHDSSDTSSIARKWSGRRVAQLNRQADGTFTATLDLKQSVPATRYFRIEARYAFLPLSRMSGPDLRVGVTQRPLQLPPDPGSSGTATLAGIDSDGDGLRDDVQREIFFMAPESEKLRKGLEQFARAVYKQSFSQGLTSQQMYLLEEDAADGIDCLSFSGSLDKASIDRRYMMEEALMVAIKNTEPRRTLAESNMMLSGSHWLGDRAPSRCSFDPAGYPD